MVNYGNGGVTHEYDGNGLRVRRTYGSSDVAYVFSGSLPIAEYAAGAAAGAYSKEYIYLGSQLIATHRPSAPYNTYFMRDHLSIRGAIADNAGYVAPGGGTAANPEEQGHLPFGESWYDSNYGFGSAPGKWEFTSYERDATSNDDYAMARRYQYGFGRFASPDPIMGNVGDPQSWNRYVYVMSDPIDLADSSGLYAVNPDGGVGSNKDPTFSITMGNTWGSDGSLDALNAAEASLMMTVTMTETESEVVGTTITDPVTGAPLSDGPLTYAVNTETTTTTYSWGSLAASSEDAILLAANNGPDGLRLQNMGQNILPTIPILAVKDKVKVAWCSFTSSEVTFGKGMNKAGDTAVKISAGATTATSFFPPIVPAFTALYGAVGKIYGGVGGKYAQGMQWLNNVGACHE
jgi:RHS repeat-associated protein